ncbi:CASP-like protein 5B2, partial [Cynara cardunculus var. scolymus]|uniref:CASP-like protein 5B2 n=1 Tax=Cynara cardunculus var. scolymus TaxID=59895 RepID=UPI000D62A7F4
VTATLSLAAACSSAGIVVLYARDLHFCNNSKMHLPCNRFEISIAMAFITWFFIAISSHVMFWLLASA